MISGHFRVPVQPHPFNRVEFRRVRWQEVQRNPRQARQGQCRMADAAMARKWVRPCQSTRLWSIRRIYASLTSAVGCSVWPVRSERRRAWASDLNSSNTTGVSRSAFARAGSPATSSSSCVMSVGRSAMEVTNLPGARTSSGSRTTVHRNCTGSWHFAHPATQDPAGTRVRAS